MYGLPSNQFANKSLPQPNAITSKSDLAAYLAQAGKKNKMRNVRTEVDGIKFQSKKEAKRWATLKLLEKNGLVFDVKRQQPIHCWVNSHKICTAVVDFVYEDLTTGLTVHEDVKGRKAGAAYDMFKLKQKLVLALHGIEIMET